MPEQCTDLYTLRSLLFVGTNFSELHGHATDLASINFSVLLTRAGSGVQELARGIAATTLLSMAQSAGKG